MRILVVEDDRKVASFIRKGLEEEGHAVEVAADGDDAVDARGDGSAWDLVVLDVMLPKRDGFSVLKARAATASRRPCSCSPPATRWAITSPASTWAPTTT